MSILNIEIKSLQSLIHKREIALASSNKIGIPDCAAYFYVKQGSLFSKKQQNAYFYFFQGLNTNPQNLSIFLRDQVQKENKKSKQKLIKGVFIIYDIFTSSDCVIQINIPGNLRIFKLNNNKKDIISNQEIDLMYLSSVIRAFYKNNLPWGRYFNLYENSKNFLIEFKNFLNIFISIVIKRDLQLGDSYNCKAVIKGSHCCSLLLSFINEKRLGSHALKIIQQIMAKDQKVQQCCKINILLAEIWSNSGKFSKSLSIITKMLKIYEMDPYLLYYFGKYLFYSNMLSQSLKILNSIVQYNQLELWLLLAEVHCNLKNFGAVLVCLNQAIKLSQIKSDQKMDEVYKKFQQLGKIKYTSNESIQYFPKIHQLSEDPTNIPQSLVEQKFKFLIQSPYWQLNLAQRQIYRLLRMLYYRMQKKKLQELLQVTFIEQKQRYQNIQFRRGLTESMFDDYNENKNYNGDLIEQETIHKKNISNEDKIQQLPHFLQDQVSEEGGTNRYQPTNRNLSIIPEIESVIENSNYQERQKQQNQYRIIRKRQIHNHLYRILKLVLSQNQFQQSVYNEDYQKILPVYNKLRKAIKYNNYFTNELFNIFTSTQNYKSTLVLIAQHLDLLEQKGIRKINKLPEWMHKYIFIIIEEKGLKFLNQMLEKLPFYDEAVIDTIEIAKNWKINGINT